MVSRGVKMHAKVAYTGCSFWFATAQMELVGDHVKCTEKITFFLACLQMCKLKINMLQLNLVVVFSGHEICIRNFIHVTFLYHTCKV